MTHPTTIETLAQQMSLALPGVSIWRRRFLAYILTLWPGVLGRRNFVNLARQGDFAEFTCRKHFQRPVDWLDFNTPLVERYLGPRRIIAIDATYLQKAGRHTAGVGYFHSGVHGQRRWGLETTGLAAVGLDIDPGARHGRQALHLEAIQTVARGEDETPLEYYAECLELRADKLLAISDLLVGDAFYAREPFIGRVVGAGFRFVSKLRKNAALRYYYTGEQSGRGRPKMYGAKVDLAKLDPAVFTREEGRADDGREIWSGVVNLKASGLAIHVVNSMPRYISYIDGLREIINSTDFDPIAERVRDKLRTFYASLDIEDVAISRHRIGELLLFTKTMS